MKTTTVLILVLVATTCNSKRADRPSIDDCSSIADNVVKVTQLPQTKTSIYEDCKSATAGSEWNRMWCLGEARSLADIDRCNEAITASADRAEVAKPTNVAKAGEPSAGMIAHGVEALGRHELRSRTSEARVQLAKLFDSAAAYFNEEHVDRTAVELLGGGGMVTGTMPHRCPHKPGELEDVFSGITPPLTVDCNQGPGGRCVPLPVGTKPTAPYQYPNTLWVDNPIWNGLNFQVEQAHFFHYAFRAKNTPGTFGTCQFTAQAFGDLDGDKIFSTFERAGAADQNGVNGGAGLYIDQEIE